MEGKYNSAAARWAAVGPYYAMFPTSFADDVIAQFTKPGDWVLDPFAGRGTTVYSAAIADRHGVGIELNPVGWLYGAAKLTVARQESVEARLREIERAAAQRLLAATVLPEFFTWCFSERVLGFLVAARSMLNWRASRVDRTLMALILVYLHGKHDASLSNQMRQTKALAPRYAVNWWRERGLRPPSVEPGEFLRDRIAWRYGRGVPVVRPSHMFLGDCTRRVDGLASRSSQGTIQSAKLLVDAGRQPDREPARRGEPWQVRGPSHLLESAGIGISEGLRVPCPGRGDLRTHGKPVRDVRSDDVGAVAGLPEPSPSGGGPALRPPDADAPVRRS